MFNIGIIELLIVIFFIALFCSKAFTIEIPSSPVPTISKFIRNLILFKFIKGW